VPSLSWRAVAIDVPSVRPNTPKLLPNVERDGYGILEERRRGFSLYKLGYTLHVRQIRSVDKLTSEGMSFIGNDLARLFEKGLPAAFSASPSLGPLEHAVVLARVGRSLNRLPASSDDHGERWRRAGTLRLVRQVPIATGSSEVMALHLDRRPRC
jgi:hypothetical protein